MKLWHDVGEAMTDAMSKRWWTLDLAGEWTKSEVDALSDAVADVVYGRRFGHLDSYLGGCAAPPEWVHGDR